MEENKKHRETIAEGLGLPDVWDLKIERDIERIVFNDDALVSDIMQTIGNQIKEEEFGEVDRELSSYEKKLIFAGLTISNKLSQNKARLLSKLGSLGGFGGLGGGLGGGIGFGIMKGGDLGKLLDELIKGIEDSKNKDNDSDTKE